MSSYKIGKIYLENFKLIKNNLLVDNLADKDFIVFDGPNGFGKTTLFDAIEVILTGIIHRVINSNIVPGNQGAEDILYLNDQDRPMKIVVEFVGEKENIVLMAYGSSADTLSKPEKRANNKNYFRRFRLQNFLDHQVAKIEELAELTQNDVNKIFDAKELDRYYTLHNYVQQEETTFFLKQKENDRMDHLGLLFDTKKEDEDYVIIKKYLDKVIQEIAELGDLKRRKTESLTTLDLTNTVGDSVIPYSQIFSNQDLQPEWDKESLIHVRKKDSLSVLRKDLYKTEIIRLIDFIKEYEKNFKNYENTQYNKQLDRIVLHPIVVRNIILTGHFLKEIPEIKQKNEKQNQRIKISEWLAKDNVVSNLSNLDFKLILNELNLSDRLETISSKMQEIEVLKKKEGELANIVRDFENTRTKLIELFKKIVSPASTIPGEECPLCGNIWPDYDSLLEEIDKKTQKIKALQSENAKQITELSETFYNTHIIPLITINDEFLGDSKNRIDVKFFAQINILDSDLTTVINSINYLSSINISIDFILFNGYNEQAQDIEQKVTEFIDYLNKQKRTMDTDFVFDNFNNLFEQFFKKDPAQVKLVIAENLSDKLRYVDQEYFRGNQQEKDKLEGELDFINKQQLPEFEKVRKKIQIILDTYDSGIQNHRIEIAKNIELPFFIYSSKILQSFEKGVGVFIQFKQSNKIENLKFTQGNDTSHDVLYSMSSGQLSALVIAFTLAMNKTYDESNLNVLLIDDPMQTMDEINMASLVDLLRNEFSSKQILLSTHESDISAFMRFKFYSFGQTTHTYNMKEEQYRLLAVE